MGFFASISHYMKIYDIVKSAYTNYKVSSWSGMNYCFLPIFIPTCGLFICSVCVLEGTSLLMFRIWCKYMSHFAVHNNILWCHEQLKFMSVVCCCFNPLPVQFKSLLHGQKGCVFFSGHLNLRTTPETGLPSREKIITIKLKKTEW